MMAAHTHVHAAHARNRSAPVANQSVIPCKFPRRGRRADGEFMPVERNSALRTIATLCKPRCQIAPARDSANAHTTVMGGCDRSRAAARRTEIVSVPGKAVHVGVGQHDGLRHAHDQQRLPADNCLQGLSLNVGPKIHAHAKIHVHARVPVDLGPHCRTRHTVWQLRHRPKWF